MTTATASTTEPTVTTKLAGKCEGGNGPDLTKYPHLTHAPSQWGEGIRVASNGKTVDAIALDAALLVPELDAYVNAHGITWAELFDALRYARDQRIV